jgi:hypothetical protein
MATDNPAKIFRTTPDNMARINEAIEASGMKDGEWIVAILLAAAGHMELSDQMIRASKAGKKAQR